jgi:hypothetical protein
LRGKANDSVKLLPLEQGQTFGYVDNVDLLKYQIRLALDIPPTRDFQAWLLAIIDVADAMNNMDRHERRLGET